MICSFQIPGTGATLVIKQADIFQQEGIRIIHCSSQFDTDPSVVNPSSLIGQFINHNEKTSIDAQIDAWISRIKHKAVLDTRLPCRQRRFDKGEVCPISTKSGLYCMATFCNSGALFASEPVSVQDFIKYWDNLWNNIANTSIPKSLFNVAVPGGNLVNVGGGYFSIEQKIGVIAYSFMRSIMSAPLCKTLTICLSGEDAKDFDFDGWQTKILPFLNQMAHVPILWSGTEHEPSLVSVPSDGQYSMSITTLNPEGAFLKDYEDIVRNLEAHNGISYEQNDGNRRSTIIINIKPAALRLTIENIQCKNPEILKYLCHPRGKGYDRNRLFQLLGTIQERSTLLGELNRRSMMLLALQVQNDEIPERWSHLGNDIDNIINYVGQKLSELKKSFPDIYSKIISAIPEDSRR